MGYVYLKVEALKHGPFEGGWCPVVLQCNPRAMQLIFWSWEGLSDVKFGGSFREYEVATNGFERQHQQCRRAPSEELRCRLEGPQNNGSGSIHGTFRALPSASLLFR